MGFAQKEVDVSSLDRTGEGADAPLQVISEDITDCVGDDLLVLWREDALRFLRQ